jgi:hypothetical protein
MAESLLHELKTLITSFHDDHARPAAHRRPRDDSRHGQPADAAAPPRNADVEGIFHLKDLQAHLTDPATNRAFKEAAQAFSRNRSIIVMSGDGISLPGDLSRLAVPLRLNLPGHDELKQMLHRVLHTLRAKQRFDVTLGPEGLEQVLQALSGLTLNQARQALAWGDPQQREVVGRRRAAARKAEG